MKTNQEIAKQKKKKKKKKERKTDRKATKSANVPLCSLQFSHLTCENTSE